LPDDDCCAIHPPEALRAAKRKTGIFMPEIQNPKSHPACTARYAENSSPPNFYGNGTPLTAMPYFTEIGDFQFNRKAAIRHNVS
jgi:hypothetical protein